jgi:hypothetical protein
VYTASFWMSRLIFSRAISARSLDNPICSAITGFVPVPPGLPSRSALNPLELCRYVQRCGHRRNALTGFDRL